MDINVNISPEQINAAVADAIIKSAIGEQLRRIIDEQVKRLSSTWDNPIKAIVETETKRLMAEILRAEFSDAIRASIRERLTDEFIATITTSVIAKATDNF